VTLAYLDVPIVNAPRFAVALVLQAALGTWVVTKLLRGAQPSLLMLLGPGLILGGALSFAIFQVVGRGVVGVVISAATGVIAIVSLAREGIVSAAPSFRLERFLHLLGLAALGMASEFEWLLIPALGCFFAGLLWVLKIGSTRFIRTAAVAIAICSFALAPVFRGAWWWIITDDYNFFEVLSRHITDSGPFAKWGMLDASRYHWLSYGWSGLLDYSAGSPNALVTLTRVMPLVYSLGLAASLLTLGAAFAIRSRNIFVFALPCWVLLANFRIDWAGTSTGGSFAVLAAVVALLAMMSTREDAVWRRILCYAGCAVVISLTKVPGTLMLPALILGAESRRVSQRLNFGRPKMIGLLSVSAGGLLAIILLLPFSKYVEPLRFEWSRDASEVISGSWLTEAVTVAAQNAWSLLAIIATLLVASRMRLSATGDTPTFTVLPFAVLWVVGVAMNVSIQGTVKANLHEYFSGPSYFLAGLTIFALVATYDSSQTGTRLTFEKTWLTSWIFVALGVGILTTATSYVPLPSLLERASFRDLISNWKVALTIVFLVWLMTSKKQSNLKLQSAVAVLAIVLVVDGVNQNLLTLLRERPKPSSSAVELELMLGPDDSREVGRWLQNNSDVRDLVATNFLFADSETQVFGDDYSLAVWSHREFLVLGPKFFGVAETAGDEIDLCTRFADAPTEADALLLSERGVSWFVVDLLATSQRSWEPYGDVAFRSDRFWVVKLRSSISSAHSASSDWSVREN
jgi:hypothetical protein